MAATNTLSQRSTPLGAGQRDTMPRTAGATGYQAHGFSFKSLIQNKNFARPISSLVARSAENTCPMLVTAWDSQCGVASTIFDTERASIIAVEAKVPDAWAQAYAVLQGMPRPEWVDPGQWRRLVDAAGVLVARWASVCENLGWDAREILGVSGESSTADFESGGLLWAFENGSPIMVTSDGITVRYGDGRTQLIRRHAGNPPTWSFASHREDARG